MHPLDTWASRLMHLVVFLTKCRYVDNSLMLNHISYVCAQPSDPDTVCYQDICLTRPHFLEYSGSLQSGKIERLISQVCLTPGAQQQDGENPAPRPGFNTTGTPADTQKICLNMGSYSYLRITTRHRSELDLAFVHVLISLQAGPLHRLTDLGFN